MLHSLLPPRKPSLRYSCHPLSPENREAGCVLTSDIHVCLTHLDILGQNLHMLCPPNKGHINSVGFIKFLLSGQVDARKNREERSLPLSFCAERNHTCRASEGVCASLVLQVRGGMTMSFQREHVVLRVQSCSEWSHLHRNPQDTCPVNPDS